MNISREFGSWRSPPLSLQILALLVGGLVIAQLVTLVLTLLLPPPPPPQYELTDIANMLAGNTIDARYARPLQRVIQSQAPSPDRPGWLTSERSRNDLARLLQVDESRVRLFFYTPLPFAGTAMPLQRMDSRAPGQPLREYATRNAAFSSGLMRVDFIVAQGGGGGGGGSGGGGGGGAGAGAGAGGGSGGSSGGGAGSGSSSGSAGAAAGGGVGTGGSSASGTGAGSGGAGTGAGAGAGNGAAAGTAGAAAGAAGAGSAGGSGAAAGGAPGAGGAGGSDPGADAGTGSADSGAAGEGTATGLPTSPLPDPTPARTGSVGNMANSTKRPAARTPPAPSSRPPVDAVPVPARPLPQSTPLPTPKAVPAIPPMPKRPEAVQPPPTTAAESGTSRLRELFSVSRLVEGDFVAAAQLSNGAWVVVQPTPEPFPNAWQRRILLWFAAALALVAPLGWLFSRRLARPIARFAAAAEQLGRDTAAPVVRLEGPAEMRRAALAFNRMQSRLRSFVDDRTAMIGAISHDLRTPLTRMRFRIEDVPADLREGMLGDVEEMERMIHSVLAFVRDASDPGAREKLDLRSIVEDVVEDAVFVGNDVRCDAHEPAPVDVDPIAIRRLLTNLVDNAIKYGTQATVRLFHAGPDAVVEVIDDGPGLPDDELEQVFKPFYRTAAARASGNLGSGMGLAVCRSIARAHGGDVGLERGAHGLIARARLPLAFAD